MKDDRGELDLTKQIDSLTETIEGYKILVNIQKEQLWKLKQISSENEKNKNLLQGYRKVLGRGPWSSYRETFPWFTYHGACCLRL
jgi:hypothetical protein